MERYKGKTVIFTHFTDTQVFLMLCSDTLIFNISSSSCFRKKGRAGSANGAGSSLQQFQPHMATLSDFDSEDELQIDETPPPRRRPSLPSKKKLAGKSFPPFINKVNLITSTSWYKLTLGSMVSLRSTKETTSGQTMQRPPQNP